MVIDNCEGKRILICNIAIGLYKGDNLKCLKHSFGKHGPWAIIYGTLSELL